MIFVKLTADDCKELTSALVRIETDTLDQKAREEAIQTINSFFEGIVNAVMLCGEVQLVGEPKEAK